MRSHRYALFWGVSFFNIAFPKSKEFAIKNFKSSVFGRVGVVVLGPGGPTGRLVVGPKNNVGKNEDAFEDGFVEGTSKVVGVIVGAIIVLDGVIELKSVGEKVGSSVGGIVSTMGDTLGILVEGFMVGSKVVGCIDGRLVVGCHVGKLIGGKLGGKVGGNVFFLLLPSPILIAITIIRKTVRQHTKIVNNAMILRSRDVSVVPFDSSFGSSSNPFSSGPASIHTLSNPDFSFFSDVSSSLSSESSSLLLRLLLLLNASPNDSCSTDPKDKSLLLLLSLSKPKELKGAVGFSMS